MIVENPLSTIIQFMILKNVRVEIRYNGQVNGGSDRSDMKFLQLFSCLYYALVLY